jgi:hypothetical protein
MSKKPSPNQAANYQIRIKGHFDRFWEDWFDGLTTVCEPDGNTLLIGYLPDQPALYGLIIKLQEMGITLLAINQID